MEGAVGGDGTECYESLTATMQGRWRAPCTVIRSTRLQLFYSHCELRLRMYQLHTQVHIAPCASPVKAHGLPQ